MPLPKRRHSKARKNKRRANDALSTPHYTNCSNCGALSKPHSVCSECGQYKEMQVLTIKSKKK